LICNDIPGRNLPVVETANRDAARRMVEHLLSLGHQRIAHITGPAHNVEAQERIVGYREALVAAGITIDEGLIWQGDFRTRSGERAAAQYLDAKARPTAVFAANDESAIGFVKTLRDAGIVVPRDVSVCGFDDIGYAAFFDPGLTTMHQPRADIGRLAAEVLIGRIAGKEPSQRRTRLTCTLIERGSIAPLKARRVSAPPAPDRRAVTSR
jgi:LacI family repressor for deo operon, udp, cdd, tsx, nupC, and nupG